MKQTFILTEGGKNIGLGHVSRCLSLYQAFESRGCKVLLVVNGDESVLKSIEGINYLRLDWVNNRTNILEMTAIADITLVDSYYCPRTLYQDFSEQKGIAAYIDDNIRFEYPRGVVINGVIGAELFDYPPKDDITYLLGKEYSFLRKPFWEVPNKYISGKISSVLITCGGNDLNGLSLRILKSLNEHHPYLEISVVLKDFDIPDLSFFKKIAKVYAGLTASEMKQLMVDSDLAVSAAGQTTYELCRTGTPFIAITTAENQAYSISRFYKENLIDKSILWNDTDLERKILEQFATLSDYNLRKKISKNMQRTITGKGSVTVVDRLLEA